MSGPGVVTLDDVKPHPAGVTTLPNRVKDPGFAWTRSFETTDPTVNAAISNKERAVALRRELIVHYVLH